MGGPTQDQAVPLHRLRRWCNITDALLNIVLSFCLAAFVSALVLFLMALGFLFLTGNFPPGR